MRFQDISQDTQTTYRLTSNEEVVFFMLNRTENITFELSGVGAKATLLSLFIGEKDDHALVIQQRHSAPKTTSHFIGKALVGGSARFNYDGLIVIEDNASGSDASQECRNLLLSENAGAIARPALEIKTDDVRCHHAATTSTLKKEALFFAESRGLSETEARTLLATGFAATVLDAIPKAFAQEKERIQTEVEKKLSLVLI